MDSIRVINSSPQMVEQYYNDSALEGVAANVKLLLKLIQEHKVSCYNKERKDGRRMLRVATMMTILDNIRSRIQKCQAFGKKRSSEDEVHGEGSSHSKPLGPQEEHGVVDDEEKAKLRRELKDSLASRKKLEIMCSSLGREKEIIAAELAMKVHQLDETDELINDLKDQNEKLLQKLHNRTSDNTERINNVVETQENMVLQERNKKLSAQLLRSLEGYRSMKRKNKEARQESDMMCATMCDIGTKVRTTLKHIEGLEESPGSHDDVQDQISDLKHIFESLEQQVAKYEQKKGERLKPKREIITNARIGSSGGDG